MAFVDRFRYRVAIIAVLLFGLLGGCSSGATVSLGADGGTAVAEGLTMTVARGVLSAAVNLKITKESKAPAELAPLPKDASAASAAYTIAAEPAVAAPARLAVPLTAATSDAERAAIYRRDGTAWRWLAPVTVSGTVGVADVPSVRGTLAVLKSPARLAIGAVVADRTAVDVPTAEVLAQVHPRCFVVGSDGTLAVGAFGQCSAPPQADFTTLPLVQNIVGGAFDGGRMARLLADADSRSRHVQALATAVADGGYAGLALDYRGLEPTSRGAFTEFISDLSKRLHDQGKRLALYLPLPSADADGGAYAWVDLSQAADVIVALPPDNGTRYDTAEQGLRQAVGLVDPAKLWLAVNPQSVERGSAGVRWLTTADALTNLAKIDVEGTPKMAPGETVKFVAPNLAASGGAPRWDDAAKAVTYTYRAADGDRTVVLANAASVGFKLAQASRWGLAGVVVEDLGAAKVNEPLWAAVQGARSKVASPAPPSEANLVAVWTSSDNRVAGEGSSAATWVVPTAPGRYEISLTVGDGVTRQTVVLPIEVAAVATPAPTPAATSTPAAGATPSPAAATPTPAAVTPTPAATPTAAAVSPPPGAAAFPGIGYGMCVNPSNDINRAFQMLRAAGFNWAKVQIRWEYTEPQRGAINFPDSVVNAAQANGVKLLFSVVAAPAWARPGQDLSNQGPPTNYADYASFVGALAAHYRGRVQAYEIWNEQNYYAEWGGPGRMNAAQYVDLLRQARAAIKAQDPSAVIVSGGLTPGGNVGNLVIDDVTFMEQMYQAGLANYADVVGVHANVASSNPPAATPSEPCCSGRKWHWSFFFLRFTQLHDVMARYGDGGKQMWFTEFGWASIQNVAPSAQPGYEYAAEITEAAHAQYLTQAYQLVKSTYPYVGVMMLWNLNYNGGPGDEKSAWSVLRQDWSQRPAYSQLAAMPK